MSQNLMIKIMLGLTLSSLVACGPAMLPGSGSSNNQAQGGNTPDDGKIDDSDVALALKQAEAAEKAVDEVEAVFGKYFDANGNLIIDLSSLSSGQSKASGFIVNMIEPSLNKVLDAVKKARLTLNTSRQKIADLIATLDSKIPAEATVLKKMMEYLKKFDQIEARITQVKNFMAEKVDWVASKLDSALAKLPMMVRLILAGEIQDLKELLARFKQNLLAL